MHQASSLLFSWPHWTQHGAFFSPDVESLFPTVASGTYARDLFARMWDSLLQLPHHITVPVLTSMQGTQWAFTLLFNSPGGLHH